MAETTSSSPHLPRREMTRSRRWRFRLAAVALGLSVLLVAEGVCRLGGWGKPTDYPDPYVGFSEVHPLFVLNDAGTHRHISPSRRNFFARESFPATKGERTFRIFCLGGSTVQGRPYSTPTSFATWLRLSLAAGDDRRSWEVVNCGGISYASYRLVPIVKECLHYEPDLFVICTGHNEFLEDRTYSHIKHAAPVVAVPSRQLSRLRTATLLRALVSRIRGVSNPVPVDRPVLPADANALLDVPNNQLKAYHRNDEWRDGVVAHYEFNLRRMIHLARAAGVPVLLVLPPSNLRDSPPFKSQHSDGLSAADRPRWQRLVEDARRIVQENPRQATERLEAAVNINPRHAATWFRLGSAYDALWLRTLDDRDLKKARAAYVAARDEDVCPLRMISPLEKAVRRVAEETETPLIDAHALLEAKSSGGILGNDFLVDHVHPSPVRGHRAIAGAIAGHLWDRDIFRPSADWRKERDAAYRRHFDALARDKNYFSRGLQTLGALKAWTQGRAEAPLSKKR